MKILVDAHALSSAVKTGKHHYVVSLIQAITRYPQADSYKFYLYSPQQLNLSPKLPSNVTYLRAPLSGPLYYLTLYFHLLTHSYDFFLSPTSYIPILFNYKKTISIIYDLAFIHHTQFKPNPKAAFIEKHLLNRVIRHSASIIILNSHIRQELAQYTATPLPPLVHLPGQIRKFNDSLKKNPSPKHPFILYVGTLEPRKNLINLIRAYHHFSLILKSQCLSPPKLLLVGKKGWYYQKIFEIVSQLNLANQVVFMGYVPDTQLPSLYQHALFFTYLPFYEGFGLPLIEALSFNQAIIASNHPVILQTLGPCGLTVDPHNIPQITQSLLDFYHHPQMKTKYQAAIPNWLSQFTPQKTSQKFYQFLKTMLPAPLPQTHPPAKPLSNS